MPEVPAVLSVLSRWRDKSIENGKNVFEQRENPGQQLLNEIEQYKLIVAELTHANEVFKKTLLLRRGGR